SVALEKVLWEQADVFASKYNSLDKARKNKMWDYLLEANDKGIAFNRVDLRARGFIPEEIDTIQDFRNFWDMHYQLENLDVVRTLRAANYRVLETSQGDKLFARPITKNINFSRVYDPASDTMRTLTKQEMDDLYANGGTLSQFRSPIDINGEMAANMMVRNSPTEYLRGMNDSDRVLNYREGYFQVTYKAPK